MSIANTRKRHVGFVSLIVFLLILSTEAQADLFGFDAITDNSGVSGSLASQFSVDVTDPGGGDALFTFYNDGPIESSITEIYFDDGSLLGPPTVINNAFVNFIPGADPGNLPAGNTIGFTATAALSAESDPENPINGVNPTEHMEIVFDLQGTQTFNDVLSEIYAGLANPEAENTLRIGIQVRGIEGNDGDSDSFVLTPEPCSLLLGSIGIGMVIARCRKRKTLIES